MPTGIPTPRPILAGEPKLYDGTDVCCAVSGADAETVGTGVDAFAVIVTGAGRAVIKLVLSQSAHFQVSVTTQTCQQGSPGLDSNTYLKSLSGSQL